jgi:hypothetical protein
MDSQRPELDVRGERVCTTSCFNFSQHDPEATEWGVDAILTDVTKTWLDLRAALAGMNMKHSHLILF